MNKTGLLALARKALDTESTEAEKITSGRLLAKEIIKLFSDPSTEIVTASSDKSLSTEEQKAAMRVEDIVKSTVARAEGKARAEAAPESPPTWVDFDPPQNARSPFDSNSFGRKPRRPR